MIQTLKLYLAPSLILEYKATLGAWELSATWLMHDTSNLHRNFLPYNFPLIIASCYSLYLNWCGGCTIHSNLCVACSSPAICPCLSISVNLSVDYISNEALLLTWLYEQWMGMTLAKLAVYLDSRDTLLWPLLRSRSQSAVSCKLYMTNANLAPKGPLSCCFHKSGMGEGNSSGQPCLWLKQKCTSPTCFKYCAQILDLLD